MIDKLHNAKVKSVFLNFRKPVMEDGMRNTYNWQRVHIQNL